MEICFNSEHCCGCTACKNICPNGAIEMVYNEKGFLYPHIREELCVECGMCQKVCPLNEEKESPAEQTFYAVQVIDEEKRRESQSGGAFSCLAEKILEQGGIVYGVGLDEELRAVYQRIDNSRDLAGLKGSKYVQADLRDAFAWAKKDLADGRTVLFSGTPCYIDGLRHYLKKENTDNLILCDLVCHGVPSPKVYADYLKYLETQNQAKVTAFCFRDKEVGGWHTPIETYLLENGETGASEQYRELFYKDVSLRESCYACPYTNFMRVSDITVGDFWGIERILPYWDDNKGISLVMINSEKGKRAFESVRKELFFKEVPKEACAQYNLLQPTARPEGTDSFWKDYADKSFRYVIKKHSDPKAATGNSFVLNNWLGKLNSREKISKYFTDRGIHKIAICGIEKNNELLASQLTREGMDVVGFVQIFDECINNTIAGKPVYRLEELSERLADQVEAVVITDEQFCAEILQELHKCGIPMHKTVPLSFVTAMEV